MRWVLMLFVILAAVMGGEARAVVVTGRVVMSEWVGSAEMVEKRADALRVESERAFLEDEAAGLVDGWPLALWFPGGSAVARSDCTDEALEWDGENRLTGMWRGRWKEELAQVPFESLVGEAVAGSTVWRWGYDHRSRRVQRDEPGSGSERLRTVTVFSGGTSAAEYTVTAAVGSAWTVPLAATVQHVRGPDLGGGTKGLLYSLRNGLPTFNRYNGRGDVVAQSDIDGTTTWAASYQADGRRTAEAGTNVERHRANCLPKATRDAASGLVFQADFAAGRSKEEDPTGLLNEGFRYRDMETGTFISRDPLGHVDGPNVYCYVRQNPWTAFDPEGLSECEAKKCDKVSEQEGKAGNWCNSMFYAFKGLGERMKFWQSGTTLREAHDSLHGSVIPAAKEAANDMPAIFAVPTRAVVWGGETISSIMTMPVGYCAAADASYTYNPGTIVLNGAKSMVGGTFGDVKNLWNDPSVANAVDLGENVASAVTAFGGARGALTHPRGMRMVSAAKGGTWGAGGSGYTLNPFDLGRKGTIFSRADEAGIAVDRSLAAGQSGGLVGGVPTMRVQPFSTSTVAIEEYLHARFAQRLVNRHGLEGAQRMMADPAFMLQQELRLKSRMIGAGERGVLGAKPMDLNLDFLRETRAGYQALLP